MIRLYAWINCPADSIGGWLGRGQTRTEGNWKSGLFELSCGHEVLFTVMNKPHSQILNELFPRRGYTVTLLTQRQTWCLLSQLFPLLYRHMYSTTQWMIPPLFPCFISSVTSSDFCQFYRIPQSVWIVLSEQTKTLIRSASMRQFYFFVSFFFSSRGQKQFLPDGSLAVSMYLHLFLNLFLHFLSRHIPNITVPLGKKSNLETW